MARVNVYLPDDLAEEVRRAELNVSRITQAALRRELGFTDTDRWLESLGELEPTDVTPDEAGAALAAARDEFGR